MKVWTLAWRVSQHKRWHFWAGSAAFGLFFTMPAASGFLLGRAFGFLAEGRTGPIFVLAGLLVVSEAVRMTGLYWGVIWFTQSWEFMRGLLRGNMLAAQMASGGTEAGEPVRSPPEAVARFRDDTEDIAWFVDAWLDVAGGIAFTVLALAVLVTVDPLATSMMLIPMLAVGITTTLLGRRLEDAHRNDRHATGEVTSLLGDILDAAITIKVNRAERPVLDRLAQRVNHRRTTAIRSRVFAQGLHSFSQSTADIGLALVVLVALGSLQRGEFGVGEIALFVSYGGWLGFLPRMIGLLLARRHQATVAFDEMANLVAGRDAANTVVHRPFPFEQRQAPPHPALARRVRSPLDRLDVVGLTLRYPDGRGIEDVSFSLRSGSFTVVTGPMGSGKTTLLRVLLGLIGSDQAGGGRVWWNGEPIDDRAAFFVPPQSAYVAQVPQLVSDSLADNVLLGGPGTGADDVLRAALGLAAVSDDVDRLPSGTATLIGPRGLRLSGGQRQRIAAARALVYTPELLVVDDLSSALDVETELLLWRNLASAGTTILAVSHRRVAVDRADQVLHLIDGRLATADRLAS